MGGKSSKHVIKTPKYIKNFNIENKASKKIEKIAKGDGFVMAPRHPSTAAILKEIEENAPSDLDKSKPEHLEHLKKVKVFSKGDNYLESNVEEKRPKPKKENEQFSMSSLEYDVDYEKYGYRKPEKIKLGNLTLRQFDEMLNEYKKEKSSKDLEYFSQKYNKVKPENVRVLVEYFKPFSRFEQGDGKNNKNETIASAVQDVFPNLVGSDSEKPKQ